MAGARPVGSLCRPVPGVTVKGMSGREEPPEPEPTGGEDDEFRSLVFDESFVRAARLEEFSARERLSDHSRAVRRRPVLTLAHPASRQGLALVLLVVLALGTALYLGMSRPYSSVRSLPSEPLRSSLITLRPPAPVPGGTPRELFAHSPAASFRSGARGVTLPAVRRTESFTEPQVLAALTAAKEYVVRTSLDPRVVTGRAVRPVRVLLDPAQYQQFDRSLRHPAADGRHAATAWMVRLQTARVALAEPRVRVTGTLRFEQVTAETLEVTADHVFVYAVRDREATDPDRASLFTVRREVRMHFDEADLRDRKVEVRNVVMQAGPLDCGPGAARALRPLLAGERPAEGGTTGTDPYAGRPATASLCGTLPASALPTPEAHA